MARKLARGLLVCFANLALLPGCQLLFPQNRAASEDARVRQELITQKEAAHKQTGTGAQERRPSSKAHDTTYRPRTDDGHSDSTVQPIPPDPRKEPNLGGAFVSTVPRATDLPGIVGTAHFEVGAEPGGAKLVPVQVPPLPQLVAQEQKQAKRAYAACAEAFQAILDDRGPDAIKFLEAYDKDTQEFFLRLLPTLTVFAQKGVNDLRPDEVGRINEQLLGVLAMLRPRSELGINKMCYCKKVINFANIEPLSANHAFLAGAPDRLGELVQLYVELKNFGSEPTPDSMYLTRLVCSLELRDAVKGEKVWSHTYDRNVTTHRRQTRLNDFYSNFSFYVPPIAPGAYQLTIQVIDESHPERHRVVRKSLDFRVTPVTGQTTQR